MGWAHSGGAVLSGNNQVMTITNQGRCGNTYFAYYDSDRELQQGDNHPVLGEHLLPVKFLDEPDFAGQCLRISWGEMHIFVDT